MRIKAITAKEAERIGNKTGYPPTVDDGRTFYAADTEETEIWEFDTKKERDAFVEEVNREQAHNEAIHSHSDGHPQNW